MMPIEGFRTMPPELESKLNELRQEMQKHGFAFGAMFVATVGPEPGHSVLWFAEEMPFEERLSMLRELKYCARETVDYYESIA